MAANGKTWDQFSKELKGGPNDWITAAGNEEMGRYFYEARERFLKGEAATVYEAKALYRRVAKGVRADVQGVTAGTLREAHLTALAGSLERTAASLDKDLLSVLRQGIGISSGAAVDGAMKATMGVAGGLFGRAEVSALFADVNDRAVLGLLSRSRHGDGLKLSDRVWRTSQHARTSIQRVIEDGVARGQSARETAKLLEKYLQPNVWTALKDETRRNLGTPKDVSMEAMRLAVTETNNAFHEGAIAGYQMMPGYKGIIWNLSNNHPVADICDSYAAHNGNGFWPKGTEPPRPHPWCRCASLPVMEDTEAFTSRLHKWAADPFSEPDIEEWYNDGPRQFLQRPQGRGVLVTPGIDLVNKALAVSGKVIKAHGWTAAAGKTVAEVSEDIRLRTVDAGVEFAAMVDAESGERIGKIIRGKKREAQIGDHILAMQPRRRYVMLHTHSSSTAPNPTDMSLLADFTGLVKNVQTVYVVGIDGTRYLLSRKPGAKVATSAEIARAFFEEEKRLKSVYSIKKVLYHNLWRNIAGRLGLIYHKVE